MEAKPLLVYYNDADGKRHVRCKVPKWQFSDKAMSVGEQYVSFNLESEVPVNFTIGDYCIYRGQYFYLNNLPTTEQKGGVRKSGDSFKYDTVRFDSDSEKLGRIIILDITPTTGDYVAAKGTNFTGSSQFQLFCAETKVTVNGKTRILTPVCYLANILKANLDRAFPNDGWQVHVNLTSTEAKCGKVQLVTHTDDKALSFNGTTAAQALAEVNNTFDLDYFIKGRDIYIGYTLSAITASDTSVKEDTANDTFFYFGYGKGYADADHQGKALFDIKRNANANQNVITRLRALGSTRNMPYRYYNKKYNLPQDLFPTNLQLPDTFEAPDVKAANSTTRKKLYPFLRDVKGNTNDSYIDKNDDALSSSEGLREGRAMWDGSDSKLEEIYPTIKDGTYRDLRVAEQKDSEGYTEKSTAKTDPNGKHSFINYLDDERVDEVLAPGKMSDTTVIDDANVGDGIDEDPAASSRGIVDIPYGYEEQAYLVKTSTSIVSINNNLLWSKELGTIPDQYAGEYTLSPNFLNEFVLGAKITASKADASYTVNISYQIVVYATPRSGGSEKQIYAFTSDRVGLTASDKFTETPIAAIPKEGEKIILTEACSVRVVFNVYAEFAAGQFTGGDSLSYFVGRKSDAADTATTFSAQFRWGPVDKSAEYLNTPFHIIIKDMGFDLKAQFNGKDSPCVEMQDGYCAGRKFKIGDSVQKVIYKENGKNYIGYQLSLSRDSDTSIHKYYPSDTNPLRKGDHYILTGIQMPDVYVRMAETRLLIAATQYLADNDETKYTYEPSLDNIYLARNYDRCKKDGDVTKSVYWNLYAGLKFPFRGLPETGNDDETLPFINITIESITIKEEDGFTPKVEMTLNEDIEQSTYNKITTAVDRIYNGSLMNEFLSNASLGGTSKSDMIALIQEQGKLKFLSKLLDDTASGLITFVKGLISKAKAVFQGDVEVDKNLDVKGNVEVDKNLSVSGKATAKDLLVTGTAHFFNLQVDKITAGSAGRISSAADGFTIDDVEDMGGSTIRVFWLAQDSRRRAVMNMWKKLDQAICQSFNLGQISSDGKGQNISNKFYWCLVTDVSGTTPAERTVNGVTGKYNWIDLSTETKAEGCTVNPAVGDDIAQLGYRGTDDASRQNANYESSYVSIDPDLQPPLRAVYRGINDFTLSPHRKTYHDARGGKWYGNLQVLDDKDDTLTLTQLHNGLVTQTQPDSVAFRVADGYGRDTTGLYTFDVERTSGDPTSDAQWNMNHKNVTSPLNIGVGDLTLSAINGDIIFNFKATPKSGNGNPLSGAVSERLDSTRKMEIYFVVSNPFPYVRSVDVEITARLRYGGDDYSYLLQNSDTVMSWSRDSGIEAEDKIWVPTLGATKNILEVHHHIPDDGQRKDCGLNWAKRKTVSFTFSATVQLGGQSLTLEPKTLSIGKQKI